MRRKELEREIPNIEKILHKADKEYVVTAKRQEDILIVDIFHVGSRQIVKKIVIEKNNHATYDYEIKEWNQRRLENNIFTTSSQVAITENSSFVLEEDLQIITDYSNQKYFKEDWTSAINRYQTAIYNKKEERNTRRRELKLNERCKEVGTKDPEGMREWMERMTVRYLYYKKRGRYALCKCSECNATYKYPFRPTERYESQFEQMIEEPEKNKVIECPNCKKNVVCLPNGNRRCLTETKYGYAFQKYKEIGVVLRYFEFYKISYPKEGVNTKRDFTEIARIFFHPDEKIQTDFNKNNPYFGETFWDDCNLYGMSNIRIEKGEIFPKSYQELEGTILQYSACKEYMMQTHGERYIQSYLRDYMKFPEIEMFVKMGMLDMATEISQITQYIDKTKRKVDEILAIEKSKIPLLRRHRGNTTLLGILRAEKKEGIYLKEEEEEFLFQAGIEDTRFKQVIKCMSIKKFINRVYRYAGVEREGELCSWAMCRIYETANTYADTLNMLILLEYDFSKYANIFPKDLRKLHNELTLIMNENENKNTLKSKDIKYPLIAQQFEELCKMFCYRDEYLEIRPAYTASEIVKEGQTLHHCVGRDNYLHNHNRGKSFILVLRKTDEPQIPYVTVEWKSGKVAQWYGNNDKKVDSKIVDKWLKKWNTRVNAGEIMENSETLGERAAV